MEELVSHRRIISLAKHNEGPGWAIIAKVSDTKVPCIIAVHPQPKDSVSKEYLNILEKTARKFSQREKYGPCEIVHYDNLADAVSKIAPVANPNPNTTSILNSLTGKTIEVGKNADNNFKSFSASWQNDFIDELFEPQEKIESTYRGGPRRTASIKALSQKELMNEFFNSALSMGRASELFNSDRKATSSYLFGMATKIGFNMDELLLRAFHRHFNESQAPTAAISHITGAKNLQTVIEKFENSNDTELSGFAKDIKAAVKKHKIELPRGD